MSIPRIDGFLFDEGNEAKFAAHGLSARQVAQVLDAQLLVVPNRKARRGVFLVIGRDHGGACIATPVERTRETGIWRPVTAWPCKDYERGELERRRL